AEMEELLRYPEAFRDESVVDNYHGVLVRDPYRWLEDLDSPETKEFVEKQINLTESVLKTCPTREKIHEKLTEIWDFPKYSAPFWAGDKYLFFHNTGLQPQSALYIQENLNGKPEILFDPNVLSKDGSIALRLYAASEDGKYLAYGISSDGSDWITLKVLRITDKTALPDVISRVKFSRISWTHDGKGFFYSCYPCPKNGKKLNHVIDMSIDLHHEVYYHFLGNDQCEDIRVWCDPENPKHMFHASVSDDGKFILLYTYENCSPAHKLFYCDISTLSKGLEGYARSKELLPFVKLVDTFDSLYRYVANDGKVFTFLTSHDAPRNKLIRLDLWKPEDRSIEVLGEDERDVLESAAAVNGDQMLVSYLSDVKNVLQLRDLKTGTLLRRLPLDIGTISDISCRRKDGVFFIKFTSFLIPGIIFTGDLRSQVMEEIKVFRETHVPGFDPTEFCFSLVMMMQVFVCSKDGTAVPMFVVTRKGIALDGSHPCLLYGYGGHGVSLTPYFSAGRLVLSKHLNAVVCVANVRGGGEYGEGWHRGGTLSRKQNSFDDFVSCAEYVVSCGYTEPRRLCIEGVSNGGLLIGACLNQRPDLFGCALAHVGVMDMLRFHKFSIGHAWTSEFGCPDKEEDFHWIIKYSPLHNVRRRGPDEAFPAVMLLTADHDDRVVPLHSLKLVATMQHEVMCSTPGKNPIIVRVERNAGHGCGMPTDKTISEVADRYGFMAKMVDAEWVD
ncbi:hypothetical protein M569_02738, partial [Genlisea aurea]